MARTSTALLLLIVLPSLAQTQAPPKPHAQQAQAHPRQQPQPHAHAQAEPQQQPQTNAQAQADPRQQPRPHVQLEAQAEPQQQPQAWGRARTDAQIRPKPQLPSAALIQKMTAEIADITGLGVKRPVPFAMISRAGWKQWVNDEISRNVKPEEIRIEELVLKRFGLIPAGYDLRQATVDLLGEQAAAVYDHRRKRMLFVEGAAEGAMEEAVLIHELSHAVADQHYDMKRFLEKGPKSDEGQTARMAVVEGQAMWIMIESQMRKTGATLVGNTAALQQMLPNMGKLAADSYPIFTKAPLYLRETLLFPYTAGLLFQQAVLEKNGKSAFADVLRKPPTSTQQVLHPEKYFAATEPTRPALPAIPDLRQFDKLAGGSIGELDFQILIQQYVDEREAREIAPKLRGGSFDLLEHKKEKYALLRWSAEWDSPDAAGAFLAHYQQILRGKSTRVELRQDSPTQLSGFNEHGGFVVTLDATRVTAVEGLKRGEAAARPAL